MDPVSSSAWPLSLAQTAQNRQEPARAHPPISPTLVTPPACSTTILPARRDLMHETELAQGRGRRARLNSLPGLINSIRLHLQTPRRRGTPPSLRLEVPPVPSPTLGSAAVEGTKAIHPYTTTFLAPILGLALSLSPAPAPILSCMSLVPQVAPCSGHPRTSSEVPESLAVLRLTIRPSRAMRRAGLT